MPGKNGISVTPYLCARNCTAALEFYKNAFGAEELLRWPEPDGRIGHAEIRIGEAVIMLADEFPEIGVVSPQSLNGTTVTMALTVPNVDEMVGRAVEAGAALLAPAEDHSYGMRSGKIRDPFGHRWIIGTTIEEGGQQ
jgi:PhnB protein